MNAHGGLVSSVGERGGAGPIAPVRAFRSPGFLVQEFRLDSDRALPRHTHDRFALVLQLEGGYTQSMGRRVFEVLPGDAVSVPAHEPHSERVGPRAARALILTRREQGTLEIPPDLAGRWVRARSDLIRRNAWTILEEMISADPLSALAVECLVVELLVHVTRGRSEPTRRPPPWIADVRRCLDDCLRQPPRLDELARLAGVSRGHLTRSFRGAYGCSIGEYVRSQRIERVADMLRDGRHPIADAALAVGFCDQSHLTREFKRHRGMTPLQYRRSH